MSPATSIGQRFIQLIQQLGLSKNAFAQSLGKTATVIQHLVEERNKPGFDLLGKVFETYPNVSRDWLMLGQGPMLLDATPPELFESAQPASPSAIDLADIPGPPRRRATGGGTLLQPADVAATVALAAAQSAHAPAHAATNALGEQPAASSPVAAPVVPPPAAVPPLPLPTPVSPPPPPAALPDPAYLAALLQAQHLQHQLALAEQRNQHLLEQQALLRQLVEVLQKA